MDGQGPYHAAATTGGTGAVVHANSVELTMEVVASGGPGQGNGERHRKTVVPGSTAARGDQAIGPIVEIKRMTRIGAVPYHPVARMNRDGPAQGGTSIHRITKPARVDHLEDDRRRGGRIGDRRTIGRGLGGRPGGGIRRGASDGGGRAVRGSVRRRAGRAEGRRVRGSAGLGNGRGFRWTMGG